VGEDRKEEEGSDEGPRTLTHKILEVMPLDIVAEVANIDPTVLLGAVAKALHHGVFGSSTFFE
jgi:hypothetical protein